MKLIISLDAYFYILDSHAGFPRVWILDDTPVA